MTRRKDAPPVYNIPKAVSDAISRHHQRMHKLCIEYAESWERDGNKGYAEYWRVKATQYDYASVGER